MSTSMQSSLAQYLHDSSIILILLGAGLSAPSGIPTFRDEEGLNYDPKWASSMAAFKQSPRLAWQYYNERRLKALHALPNPAHHAVTELARLKPHAFTITQNIDGLSHKAGHDMRRLVEFHGSLFTVKCSSESCAYVRGNTLVESLIPASSSDLSGQQFLEGIQCPQCAAGLIRPGIVWFGEKVMSLDRIDQWLFAVPRVDLMLVVGTSARVFPAAEFIHHAREKGAYIAHFNLERDDDFMEPGDWFVPGDVAVTLPRILREAML